MSVHSRVVRTALVLSTAVALSAAIAACGSSNNSSSASAAATTGATASAGQSAAQAIVAKLTKPVPFTVVPLSKTPPKDKTLIEVNCTLPICVNGAAKVPTQKLGWKYINDSFDVTQGPPAYAAALTRALQDKPNYILTVGIFPPATVKPILAKIAAAGITVVQLSGLANNPAIKACDSCAAYLAQDGKIQADMITAALGTKAETVDVGDPTVVGSGQIDAGLFAEFKRLGATPPKKLQISISNPPAENAAAVINYLQRNPDTKAVVTGLNSSLVSLPGAMAQAGLGDKVQYYGSKPTPADIQAVKDGQMTGNTVIESNSAFWQCVDSFARFSVGDPVQREPSAWVAVMDKANFSSILDASNGQPEPPAYQDAYLKAWKLG